MPINNSDFKVYNKKIFTQSVAKHYMYIWYPHTTNITLYFKNFFDYVSLECIHVC